MNRHYDTSLFESRITMIKDMIPDAFIGVDVIAGARGETREEWEKGIAFIESLPITRLHVFPYSERPELPPSFSEIQYLPPNGIAE